MKSWIAVICAVAATANAACSKTQIEGWIRSCDSLPNDQAKCDSRTCHRALHWLVEPEIRDCYVSLGMGPASDLDKYIALDEFCHAADKRAMELELISLLSEGN